jgi:hypothetical protein
MFEGGIFSTIKLFISLFAFFAAYMLGKMAERPKDKWPRDTAGKNPILSGSWNSWQRIFMGVVALAVLFVLLGEGGLGSMFGGMGGMGGAGYGRGGYY